MDKYEYKLKLEQIKNLVEAKDYKAAVQIADGINWKKVKSVATLCMIGELYEKTRQLEESREILLMAYDRSPVGRNIIYRLTHVAIKLGSLEEAQEYYEEFIEIAPHDNMKYVLKYEIARAKGVPLPELISILEEFKEREYTEEWAFELAYLYHKNGNGEKCVEICDELILWFGEGRFVEKALELKMLYQPLNKLQEDKYRRFKQKKEGIVEVSPYDALQSGEIVRETVKIPNIHSDTGRFNTVNLQAELAKSMQQIMEATEQEMVNDTINNIKKMVGEVPSLYEAQPELETTQRFEIPSHGEQSYEEEDAIEETDLKDTENIPEVALDIDFKGILSEEYDGQFSLHVPDAPKPNPQITGQMSIEDILAEWERTKEAARAAIAEAEQRKLEDAKARALREAEGLMERLNEVSEEIVPEEMTAAAYTAVEEMPVEGYTTEEEISGTINVASEETLAEAVQKEAVEEEDPEQRILEQEIMKQQEKEQQILEQQIREEQMIQKEVTLEKASTEERPITRLDEEQRQVFTYFALIGGMESQICQALEGAKQRKHNLATSGMGNLAIVGGKGSGKTVLATDFIKAYQKLTDHTDGKVGKISASVLNQKDIQKLFAAVEGGYLIIEKAGDLSKESVEKLSVLMEGDTKGMLVIMEDDRDGIAKAMGRNVDFSKKFTERINIPVFTSDELVTFAKAYARENQCEIEDMGVLALYNSISNIQRLDEATTLAEVKEIMDEAIYRAKRGGLKKLFGGKRTTENGLVLIKEKDFDE